MAIGPWTGEFPPTGRFDDLLAILARADHERLWDRLPRKTRWARGLLFPAAAAAGRAIAALLRWAGPARALAVHEFAMPRVSGKPGFPFDPGSPGLSQARELLARSRGRRTAVLCLVSHPPVLGELFYLNIELVRHTLLALSHLRPGGNPRFLVAIDPYALDTQPTVQEGLYAGFMGDFHIGLDRQAHLRGALEHRILGHASWTSAATRLCSALGRGGEIGMVLAGGVPTTARVLYAVREFLGELRRGRPGIAPLAAFSRLAEHSGDFAAFCRSPAVGGALRRSVWRMMEAWVMETLTRTSGEEPSLERTEKGVLGPEARTALEACAEGLGFPAPEAIARAAAFEGEFARETPYRERLLRILAGRVAGSGTDILLLPLRHGPERDPAPRFGEPCLLRREGRGAGFLVSRLLDGALDERGMTLGELARAFGRANFL